MRSAWAISALLVGTLGIGAGAAAQGFDAAHVTALERLVIQDCGSCHGLTLKGGLGRAITPELMQAWELEDLRDVILDGIPGTAMPPWRPLLTEAEATWIAEYLRGTYREGDDG